MDRRDFLQRSGALIVAFSAGGLIERLGVTSPVIAQGGDTPQTLDSWVVIGADDSITVYTGRADMGQGIFTVQAQLAAEELSVPVERVRLVECDTSLTPDQGTSSGSQAHPVNFNTGNLAQACATAREALIALAATRLNVPANALRVADGVISVAADASRSATYGALIGGRRFNLPIQSSARRKNPRDWTVLGTSAPRLDLTDIVTGRFEFVHNVRVPGMVHGRAVRPPSVGATLAGVDESSVRGLPGNVRVVTKKNWVGVVADKPWQALQAAEQLKVMWTAGAPLPPQRTFYDFMRRHPGRRDAYSVDSGDVDARLAGSAARLSATYLHPYQMHGSMGSSCAVADVRGDRATIWSATQAVYPLRSSSAMVLGIPPENIRVIYVRGSGCYGINGADAVSYDAALLSQAVGRPVRVQFTRKDEMVWGENYGLPFVIDQRVGLDAGGTIVAWDYESWSATLGNRPGTSTPGNVHSGMLAGFAPAAVQPRVGAPPPAVWNNGGNAVPGYLAGRIGGRANGTGTVASERVLTHAVASPFLTGPLRSPQRLQNAFAQESFLDEIAAHVKADPVQYRLRHLADPRLKNVVTAAAQRAGWETRPSPRPGNPRRGVANGRGIAGVLYEGDNGYVALVADVDVDQDTGAVTTRRLVVAQDVGPISSPDGLRNQLEGGALQGLSRALGEEVTWDATTITSVDWASYRSLYVGSPGQPTIDCVLINQTEGEAMGAGETAITIVAAAVGNAIFDATAVRIREVPFTAARVKAVIDAAAR